ncbi:hypothetical protein CC78DRAFT_208835 [Lojkania enalia]|uniref:DUF4484 domain-containing protein n=1 Tax=Lojkania enalia TaxID=147567 RepID=A0A9P4KFN2_9PLEO|nr:hypothetical protein CC78DRAFT_208835 [Didymosphaeria enalia]
MFAESVTEPLALLSGLSTTSSPTQQRNGRAPPAMPASTDSSVTDVESSHESEAPQLSALFLIKFDQKIGYTIAWKRASVDVLLDGAVEYKSLPSGLHSVKSDLVYFVHEGYAGLSAFANAPASEAERNANFVAVGILVPLSYGRLGRSWLHAPRLQKIASTLAQDSNATAVLEEFWDEQLQPGPSGSTPKLEPPKSHSRARALSMLTAVIPSEQSLPQYHPALAIIQYIEVFGPLVFRLQQAALLRKRILFIGSPPVRSTCEFVFILSLLATIPNSVSELLSPGTESLLRLRTLFSVGIHDIPLLENFRSSVTGSEPSEDELPSQGWVACTTDEILATKTQLYDIIVEMPHTYDAPPEERQWPIIKTSDGMPLRASQRDVWRYKLLQQELRKYRSPLGEGNGDTDENDQTALLHSRESDLDDDSFSESYDDKVAEPLTWSRLAYMGFMWWASAGEKDAYEKEERERDRELLGDLSDFQSNGLHTSVIAYFHRSTASLITSLAGLIEAADDEDVAEQDALVLSKDDISRIGLDGWSEGDKAFLQEFIWCYFGRRAEVHGASVECCGCRVPAF